MKKRKESKIRNRLGMLQATLKLFHLNILVIVPGITTIVSLIATVVTSLIGKEIDVLLIVTISSSLITLLTITINLIKNIKQQKQMIIHTYSNEELDRFYDNDISKSGYSVLKTDKSRLMYSKEQNEFVKNQLSIIPYNFKHNPKYSLPDDVSKNAFRIFSEYLKSGKHFYDSRKIRMNNDIEEISLMPKEKRIIQLSKTTYFNSICTNEMSIKEMRYDNDVTYCFDGYALVKAKGDKNKDSRIYSLSESQCSNHIGVSTLVVSNDNYVIITKQGKRNLVGSDKYIVSASGSVDYKDRKGCSLFSDIIIKAMERELSEECLIDKSDILNTTIIGYGRLLDRGGKPEFFGITKVNLCADEIIEKGKRGKEVKKGYVSSFVKIENEPDELKKVIDVLKKDNDLTVQLSYYFDVLL